MIFPGTWRLLPPPSPLCKGYLPPPSTPRAHADFPARPTAVHPVHPISRHFSDPLTSHHLGDPSHSQLRPGTRHLGQSPHHASEPTHSHGHQDLGKHEATERAEVGRSSRFRQPEPRQVWAPSKEPKSQRKSPHVTLTWGGTRQRWDFVERPCPPSWLFPDLIVPAPPNPSLGSSTFHAACNLELP